MLKYNMKIVTILILILMGLSCNDNPIVPNLADANFIVSLEVLPDEGISETDNGEIETYANSCEGCIDVNPTIFRANLSNNGLFISDESLIFTFKDQATPETITTSSNVAFSYITNNVTDASGNVQVAYNDEGKAGKIKVFAQYLNSLYPNDLGWKDSTETINLKGYWTLADEITVFSNNSSSVNAL